MDSNFFFPVTIHQNGVTVTNVAQWVSKLPINPPMGTAVVVLYSTEGVQLQGMYLHDTQQNRWRYLIPYLSVCEAVIKGSTLDLYTQVQATVTPGPSATIWRNGVQYSGTDIEATPTVAWAVLTPVQSGVGSVTSVNNVGPDGNGNVSIGISDIPGLQTALDNAGTVKSVNSQSPNAQGNVTLRAEDNSNATGISLIADNGATDGTFKFKTLVAGSNVTVTPDTNGNLVIAATGGGSSGVTSVALALPSIFSVSGSPVTTTGTLTGTLVDQNANTAFMGPASGAPGTPTFRTIGSTDLPLATTSAAGAVIVGSGLTVTSGTVSANVLSVAGRTGAITLTVSDVAGAAPLLSPAFEGLPTAPTASPGTNTGQLATTAFVEAAVIASGYTLPAATSTTLGGVIIPSGSGLTINASGDLAANVLSVAGRTGAVTLTVTDVSGAAPLLSPTFTGTPKITTTPATGDNSTAIADTAYVYAATQGSQTVALSNISPVVLVATQYSAPVIVLTGALTANITVTVPTTGEWDFVNATTGAFTVTVSNGVGATQVVGQSTTAFTPLVSNATEGVVALASTASGVTSFNTRTGAVTLLSTDISSAGGALLASPAFTGRVQSPAASYSVQAIGTAPSTVTMDLGSYSEFMMTISVATTLAFTNTPAAGTSQVVYIRFTNAGSATVTWPTGTKFAGLTAPTFTASGVDLVGVTYDTATSTYMVFVIGLNIG